LWCWIKSSFVDLDGWKNGWFWFGWNEFLRGDYLPTLPKTTKESKPYKRSIKLCLKPRLIIAKTSPLILMPVKSLPTKRTLNGLIKGNKSYMPMVGHIAQTGQIVATDFKAGNVSPNTDNLGFIKISQDALP
jgi:hypothetical protein